MASIAALALASGWGSAHAADQSILVLPIEHGSLSAPLVKDLDRVARERAHAAFPGTTLMPAPALTVPDLLVAAGCAKASYTCFAGIGRTVGASQVVRVQVDGTAERAKLTVTHVRVASKRGSKHTASIDDLPNAIAIFGWHVEKGAGGDPAPLTGQIKLLTQGGLGSLEGAELFLDDQRITPAALDKLAPGEHHLIVKQQGFESVHWRGAIEGGRTETVRVEFVPEKKAEPPPPPPPPPALATAPPPPPPPSNVITGPVDGEEPEFGLFYTLIFGGAAALVGAAWVWTKLDTLSIQREVEGPAVPGNCYWPGERDTYELCQRGESREPVLWGLGIGAGALALTTLVALYLEWPDGTEPGMETEAGSQVGVSIAPTAGGAAAGLSLTF